MKRIPFQSLLCSPLSTLLLCVLLLVRLACAQTPPAATPMPTAFWHKAETAPQTMMRRIVDLEASSDLKVRDVLQVPRKREIEVDATLARRVEIIDGEHVSTPFWVGRCGFDAVGYVVQPDGTRRDLYNPQNYLWSVDPDVVVPLRPTAPPLKMQVALAGTGGLVQLDTFSVDRLPPSLRELYTLAFEGGPEGGDGRPLEQLKPGPSTPNKYFYWNLGELGEDSFLQSSTARVGVTGGAGSPVHLAQAKVNWQLPPLTAYKVEISLWDWVDDTEAPSATFEEFWDKLTTDREFQKDLVKDGLTAAARVALEKGVNKIVGTIITSRPQVARDFARRLATVTQTRTLKAFKPLPGQPAAQWLARADVHVTVEDKTPLSRFRRLIEDQVNKEFNSQGRDYTTPEGKQEVDEEVNRREEERKGRDRVQLLPRPLYLYTSAPTFGDSYWDNPSRTLRPTNPWPEGYYLTDMPPDEAQRLAHLPVPGTTFSLSIGRLGQHASALRRGQFSFALFGHPYAFEGPEDSRASFPVRWRKINMGDLRDGNGTIVSPGIKPDFHGSLLPRGSSDTAIPYHGWGYSVFLVGSIGDAARLLDQNRYMGQGTVSFHTGSPGVEDVPAGDFDLTPNQENNPPADTAQGFGIWTGVRGSSDWMPRDAAARAVTNQQRVTYSRNYPDLSRWSRFSTDLRPLQKGTTTPTRGDFEIAGQRFADDMGWRETNGNLLSPSAVYQRIGNLIVPDPRDPAQPLHDPNYPNDPSKFVRGYTWHHNENLRTMELIPRVLHQDCRHQGGASFASAARW